MRRAALIAVALSAALVPLPRGVIDRLYTHGLYAAVQPRMTALSNVVSFALGDALLVAAALALAAALIAAVRVGRRRGWRTAVGTLVLNAAAAAAAVYLAFLLMWGLNYRSQPLAGRLDYAVGRATQERAIATAKTAVASLNTLHQPAHAAGWSTPGVIDHTLAAAFDDATRALGGERTVVARPKTTILQPYFSRSGVAGMTEPFFLETLVDGTLLPFERPFVVAHEWAHLAGYADEGEANFVGWLAAVRAGPAEQYSGWLFIYEQLARAVPAHDGAELRRALDPGVAGDLRAIAERLSRNINPRMAAAGWRVYDRYLKANRVSEGAASYDTVVRLVLGVRFEDGWRPVVLPRE